MTIPQQQPQQPVQQQPAQAPEPQSVDDAIGHYARGLLQQIDQDTDPDQMDTPPAQEEAPQQTQEPEAPEPEAETPAQPEVPMVEVEVDGEKFNIPEKVKHRVMADKDYRQKTMEVAATRKQLDALTASAAQLTQQAHQMAPYHAELFAMEKHAQSLQHRLQSRELADDPVEYNRVQGELAILLHNKDRYAQGLQQHVSQLNQQRQELRTKQLMLDAPKLFQDFPELAKPETQAKVVKYLQEEGLPEEALDYISYSTGALKLVWKAHQYDQMVSDQAKAKAKLSEKQKTLPAAVPTSRADGGAKDQSLRDGWRKRGGSINDPAFNELLRSQIRR